MRGHASAPFSILKTVSLPSALVAYGVSMLVKLVACGVDILIPVAVYPVVNEVNLGERSRSPAL